MKLQQTPIKMPRCAIVWLSLSLLSLAVFAQPRPVYPLKISANKRYFVDQKNRPFLLHADTAWMIFYKLDRAEVEQYLESRRQLGFNTILAQFLAYGKFQANKAGEYPLLNENDLGTPNEKFFANADWVIRKAAEKGIQVLIAPAWLDCCNGGWREKMKANGVEKNRAFGLYIGKRYKDVPNLMWLMLGDRDPGEYLPFVRAMAEGIKAGGGKQLMSAHAGSPRSARDVVEGESWLDFNTTYTYWPNSTTTGRPQFHVYASSRKDYQRTPVMPFILIESCYENERQCTPQMIRRQAWWSVLSGSTGQALGNAPIYGFDRGWPEALHWRSSQDMAQLWKLLSKRAWWKLEPDVKQEFIVAGYGRFSGTTDKDTGYNYVTAMCANDGSFALAYLPESRSIEVNLSKLAGKVRARWFDPVNGVLTRINGSPFANRGVIKFTPPAQNSGGDHDFVLVLEQ
jgi:hypothetical protein